MKLKNIKAPSISKEKFEQSYLVKNKLSYENWIEYIDANQDYFVWYENTEDGKFKKENLNKIPEAFRDGQRESLTKREVLSEYNKEKGYYEIVIDFHKDIGIIKTTFMKKVTKKHLLKLLDMANYLDAHLLNNGNEIIDKRFIEELK